MRLAILVLVLLAAPAAARADDLTWGGPPGMTPYVPPPKVTREVSYAHQTLISDGIAAAAVTAAFLQDDPYSALLLVGLGVNVYALGAPIVHFAHGQAGNGFASFGVRIGLPLLGSIAGNLLGPKDTVLCEVGSSCPDATTSSLGLVIGAGVGAIAAVAVDARYLARKRVVDAAPPFTPTIGYYRAGFTVGVGGSF